MTDAVNAIRLAALAHQLADRACIADIETEAIAQTDAQGRKWHDTRPMLDPREMPDDCVEMNRQALAYAHERGLISPHPQHAHLVRITKAGT
jgi:hypothetical protein